MSEIEKIIEQLLLQRDAEKIEYSTKESIENHKNMCDTVISALEELQQYRAIGTIRKCSETLCFKKYFDELYGQGLEVANWHNNGDTEPFDNFYEDAINNAFGESEAV